MYEEERNISSMGLSNDRSHFYNFRSCPNYKANFHMNLYKKGPLTGPFEFPKDITPFIVWDYVAVGLDFKGNFTCPLLTDIL